MRAVQTENDLNIRHLRIFLAVCDNGNNLSRAAEMMYTTQPAISLVIHELEEHYRIALFDRLGRRLYLTPAGEQFRTYVLRVLSLIDDMELNMKNIGGTAPLRIGGSITVGSQLMPDWVSTYQKLHPGANIHVEIRHSQELGELIQKNQLDLAVVEAPIKNPILILDQFLEDRLAVLTSTEMTVDNRIPKDTFVKLPFLLREKGSGTRYIVDHIMDGLGMHIEPVWESQSSLSLINATKKGLGVTIVPRTVAKEFIERGEIREIHPDGIVFQQKFYLIHHKDKILSTPLQEFIVLCRTHLAFAD